MSCMIKITIEGLDKVISQMGRAPAEFRKALQRAVNKSTLIIQKNIKSETPVKTGRLQKSIDVRFGSLSGVIFTNLFYAPFVHFGTRPHTIHAKSKKALSWKGALHPVKSVQHPGSKGNPFMDKGVEKSQNEIDRVFKEEVDKSLNVILSK